MDLNPTPTTPTPTTTSSRRTSKRPSSQLLSQIKSQQTKLKKQALDEERDAEMIAQQEEIEFDAPQQHQYDSNSKEFFYKIGDQVEWAIMRVASFPQLIKEVQLVTGDSNVSESSIRIRAMRGKIDVQSEDDYKKLRDHGEMLKIEI